MSVFSFVQTWLGPALYMSIIFLGFHFAALILVHMYFSYMAMATAAASVLVTLVILFMHRTARTFKRQQTVIKTEKERMKVAAATPAKPKHKTITSKLKKAQVLVRRGHLPIEDASEV
jgi:membrane protein implicated in regulation of membrane protease activity